MSIAKHLNYLWLVFVLIGVVLVLIGLPYKINPDVIIDLDMLIDPLNYNNVTHYTPAFDFGLLFLLIGFIIRSVRWDDLWRAAKF